MSHERQQPAQQQQDRRQAGSQQQQQQQADKQRQPRFQTRWVRMPCSAQMQQLEFPLFKKYQMR